MKNDINAAIIPPASYATMYITPIKRYPRNSFSGFFLNIWTKVTQGLKCAPEIATPKSVTTQYPSKTPAYLSPIKR